MPQSLEPVIHQLQQVLLDKPVAIRLALTCLIARGHLLIEDLPGMGKTTLSYALARTLGLSHQRVQFTADMLPADLIGVSIYTTPKQQFEFHPGPLFSQLVLADEVNRASPKTQSALLEAMAEGQVSTDGITRALPQPFFVIATQNPMEQSGTFPLPESQLDRFMMKLSLGYPSLEAEKQLLTGRHLADSGDRLSALMGPAQLQQLQQQADQVGVADMVLDYLLELIQASRNGHQGTTPLSPRCSRALLAATKAWALLHGRSFAVPDDVQAVFTAVTEHRLEAGHHRGNGRAQSLLEAVNPIR
ncbi:MoxR family ATPase [Ferrimonas sp. SCSIO 43195]|uniref:AAA family ATPase n=1 Tax=Ferrimonas sp. SCSIO 43195 TaxID=2822844 RepID=UPI002075F6C6|nr:AAA family ATPase [Ferrimonas sp. SCSIO 43195]USD38823.1 AAA family ATPase [Ferrimonas sp. SCSIO 43195]